MRVFISNIIIKTKMNPFIFLQLICIDLTYLHPSMLSWGGHLPPPPLTLAFGCYDPVHFVSKLLLITCSCRKKNYLLKLIKVPRFACVVLTTLGILTKVIACKSPIPSEIRNLKKIVNLGFYFTNKSPSILLLSTQ